MANKDQLLGRPAPGWQGRLKEAAYTGPDGQRHAFNYVSVSRVTPRRTTAFEIAGADNDYVQDNGIGGRQYPMVCIFDGTNHDVAATNFELAVSRGVGRLEHPTYGTFDAISTGEIVRTNETVDDANASFVAVTFQTTLPEPYPKTGPNQAFEIQALAIVADEAAAATFAATANTDTIPRQLSLAAIVRAKLKDVSDTLAKVRGFTSATRKSINAEYSAIGFAVETLVGDPVRLAREIQRLVLLPATLQENLKITLLGYFAVLESIFASSPTQASHATSGAAQDAFVVSPTETTIQQRNDFAVADLIATTAVSGSARTARPQGAATSASATRAGIAAAPTASMGLRSRAEAIKAAEDIQAQADALNAYRDKGAEDLAVLDAGDSSRAVEEQTQAAIAVLVATAAALRTEKTIQLDRNRNLVELCAELYQRVDNETLDDFQNTNDFSGDQLLELSSGDWVTFYV